MGRTPNDDRSDSMNPNNDAYWASEANHQNQTGGWDDDDGDYALTDGSHTPAASRANPPASITAGGRTLDVSVSCVIESPRRVEGLSFIYLEETKQREQKINVDSPSIEAAIQDAETLWNKGGIAFLALYDRKSIYLEKSRNSVFEADVINTLSALGDFRQLVQITDKDLSIARRALDVHLGQNSSHDASMRIRHFGSCKAASNALHEEMAQRIQELNKQGMQVTLESLAELAWRAKLSLKAEASATWIRDFQKGKVRLDPLSNIFPNYRKISDIRL